MKKIFPYIFAIILTVIIFTGCKPLFPNPYDQFDYGDTVQIAIGETIYESKEFWFRLDSISEDSRCPTGSICIREGRVVFWMTVADGWGESLSLSFSSDTCMERSIYFNDDPLHEPGNLFGIYIISITPYPVVGQTIQEEDYRIEFVLQPSFDVDRKPNLYLYPEKKTKVSVSMEFPHGGKVIESIPAYPKKWDMVKVKPNGKIDRKFDYLFYECEIPDFWQYVEGWVIKREDLPEFFKQNLKAYGFNDAETEDFIDFWIPELKEDPFYMILPQYTEMVNQVIKLWIRPRPDKLMRLHYVISGSAFDFDLPEPEIPVFEREGFTAVEWGVILK